MPNSNPDPQLVGEEVATSSALIRSDDLTADKGPWIPFEDHRQRLEEAHAAGRTINEELIRMMGAYERSEQLLQEAQKALRRAADDLHSASNRLEEANDPSAAFTAETGADLALAALLPTEECERCGGKREIVVAEPDDEVPERTFRQACPDCTKRQPEEEDGNYVITNEMLAAVVPEPVKAIIRGEVAQQHDSKDPVERLEGPHAFQAALRVLVNETELFDEEAAEVASHVLRDVRAALNEATPSLDSEAALVENGDRGPIFYDHIVYRLTCLLNGRSRPTLEQIRDEFKALRDGTGPSLTDIVAEGRCEECGTLKGLWHKLGCSHADQPSESAVKEGEG